MVAFALVGGSLGFGLASAPAAVAVDPSKGSPGFCPTANGVTVVVDFQELGGTTIVRCAPGDQTTGLTALKNAGIQITGTNRWGESFICRVEGKPGPSSEPCVDTPPASAYWSYWHSPNGGNWSYSQWGVTNRKPPIGSFEGWSFAKDKTESSSPPPRVAPSRPSDGSNSGGGSGSSGAAGGSSGGGGTTGGASGGAASGGSGGGVGGSSGGSGGDTSTVGGATGAGGSGEDDDAGDKHDDADERQKKDDKDDDKEKKEKESADPRDASEEPLPGTAKEPTEASDWTGEGEDSQAGPASPSQNIPMGTVAGIGAVALLLTAAGVAAWRRRSAERESGTEA